jgi:hypothetical protein
VVLVARSRALPKSPGRDGSKFAYIFSKSNHSVKLFSDQTSKVGANTNGTDIVQL